MNINVEKIHSRWMNEMSSFAWQYMRKRHPKTRSEAVITYLPSDEELKIYGPSLAVKGKFELPPGSGSHIMQMALFAKATFFELDGIRGLEDEVVKLPETMFCLHSVLIAAFPKNLETDTFRPIDAADFDFEDPSLDRNHPFNAFAGIGLILMDETRKILSPMSPDADVTKMADGLFLSVFDKGEHD